MRASNPTYALLAVAGSLVIGGPSATAGGQNPESQTSSPRQSANARQFTPVWAGMGILEGVHTSVKTYKAENGENVQLIMAHFRSGDDARKALQNMKKLATKVTEQDHAPVESGKIVSDRSVLILPAKDQKIATAIVVITGSDFWEVVSYSAQDAFAFENFANSQAH